MDLRDAAEEQGVGAGKPAVCTLYSHGSSLAQGLGCPVASTAACEGWREHAEGGSVEGRCPPLHSASSGGHGLLLEWAAGLPWPHLPAIAQHAPVMATRETVHATRETVSTMQLHYHVTLMIGKVFRMSSNPGTRDAPGGFSESFARANSAECC